MNEIVQIAFNYASLGSGNKVLVTTATQEIRDRIGRAAQNIMEIGSRLILVKKHLDHGQFGQWLKAEFDWSESTAQKMMSVADTFKSVNFTDLSVAPSALYMLAAPSTPDEVREEFIEKAKSGETVTHKAVKDAVKPKPTQAEIDAAARSHAERDIANHKRDVANDRKNGKLPPAEEPSNANLDPFGIGEADGPADAEIDAADAASEEVFEPEETERQEDHGEAETGDGDMEGMGGDQCESDQTDTDDPARPITWTDKCRGDGEGGKTESGSGNRAAGNNRQAAVVSGPPWKSFVENADESLDAIEREIRKLGQLFEVENATCNAEYASAITYPMFKALKDSVRTIRDYLPGEADACPKGWVTRGTAKGRAAAKKSRK